MVTSQRLRLTARLVRNVTRPGRYGDGYGGHGLSLLVKETSSGPLSKTWSQRLRVGGKETMVGLGPYPLVTLAEARTRAIENARAVRAGRHPAMLAVPTFAEAAETVIAERSETWRSAATAQTWRRLLDQFALPVMGGLPVTDITRAHIYTVLKGCPYRTSRDRLAATLRAVMSWVVGAGFRDDDPSVAALAALPRRAAKVEHHAAIAWSDLPDARQRIRSSGARPAVRLAWEMVALTACRTAEVRGMTWPEADLDAAVWTIPADRYKTGRAHRVPLSAGALAVLEQARNCGDTSGLVFPGSSGSKEMAVNALRRLSARLDLGTVHGLRTAFRSWAADTGVPDSVAEAALGHVVAGVAGAYQRSDLLERRRPVMQAWSDYLTSGEVAGPTN